VSEEINEELKRRVGLERGDAARIAIGEAIQRIERLDGNPLYQKAWKVAIRSLREMKLG
jgi:hypothetical protein